MPVRYAVVPEKVMPELPTWAGGDRVKSVPLARGFKYALRTMREGYFYLFYSKNARGTDKWECYTVFEDGSLLRQPSPKAAASPDGPSVQCSRNGHSNVSLHYIVIDQPHKCGPTWIAFSPHKWSDETLAEYTKNTKLRNKRMQTIHPAPMAHGAKHSHGSIATSEALEGVLEYVLESHVFPHDGAVPKLTRADGSLTDPNLLERVCTREPWHLRLQQADRTVANMQQRGVQANGQVCRPHVLALWDAIGITHELNGFRNDAAGWTQKYLDECDLQLSAIADYDGLKVAMTSHAGEAQKDAQESMDAAQVALWYEPSNMAMRRANSNRLPEPQRSRELETCDLLDEWAAKQLPDVGFTARLSRVNLLGDAERSAELRKLKSDVESLLHARSEASQKNIAKASAGAWPRYQERIARTELVFRKNSSAFSLKAAALIDARTQALIHWLEASLFIDTLNDYHGRSISDGVLFDEMVGEAIFGLGSCKVGATKIMDWVQQCKATVEENLLWRAVALNQDDARQELDLILAEAKLHKSQQTLASGLTWFGYTGKSAKVIAETYKKLQGVVDFNNRSKVGGRYFGAGLKLVRLYGIDRVVITCGESIFRYFRVDKFGDYASEKIIQHAFSLRALVNATDSENLVAKQAHIESIGLPDGPVTQLAKNDGINYRYRALRRISATKAFMRLNGPAVRTKQAQDLEEAWAKFKSIDLGGGASRATRDGRLAVVVMLIEMTNFSKLLIETKTKGDSKTHFSLLASALTITGALLEIISVPARDLPYAGVSSTAFQMLKGWGGVLSAGGTAIGAVLDFADARKSGAEGYTSLYVLQMAKGVAGVSSAALTLAVTYTHAAGIIAQLTRTAVLEKMGESVIVNLGPRAAAVVGLRIFAMAGGGWLTVGLFGFQVMIWIVTPDALEKWLDHSAFGARRDVGAYKTARSQGENLQAALVELGLQ